MATDGHGVAWNGTAWAPMQYTTIASVPVGTGNPVKRKKQSPKAHLRLIMFKNDVKARGLTEEVYDKYPDLVLEYGHKIQELIAFWAIRKKQKKKRTV